MVGKTIIEAQGVSKVYGSGQEAVVALDDISFKVTEGELVCMLGPSGCGKTTMLNIVAGFETASSGQVLVGGNKVSKPAPDRGYVFQDHGLFPWLTISQNVGFGLLRNKTMSKEQRKSEVQRYLHMVGLSDFGDVYPHQLSGGMRQRAAIGRALAPDPQVVLMDEPFAALDAQTRYAMQIALLEIRDKSHKTILFVTHSIDEALMLSDRVMLFSRRPGRLRLVESIKADHPRAPNDPAFSELKDKLFTILQEERQIDIPDNQTMVKAS
ncbi:ABC transporter ATP-binding protein [Castellaniella sp.]|uniref:ABC transporter ATP-binding protein n=1 Tax=Castellaniella sp. TaxID=1955812 RepID=UPI003565BB15